MAARSASMRSYAVPRDVTSSLGRRCASGARLPPTLYACDHHPACSRSVRDSIRPQPAQLLAWPILPCACGAQTTTQASRAVAVRRLGDYPAAGRPTHRMGRKTKLTRHGERSVRGWRAAACAARVSASRLTVVQGARAKLCELLTCCACSSRSLGVTARNG